MAKTKSNTEKKLVFSAAKRTGASKTKLAGNKAPKRAQSTQQSKLERGTAVMSKKMFGKAKC